MLWRSLGRSRLRLPSSYLPRSPVSACPPSNWRMGGGLFFLPHGRGRREAGIVVFRRRLLRPLRESRGGRRGRMIVLSLPLPPIWEIGFAWADDRLLARLERACVHLTR